jgi:hypothetical protein
VAPRNQGDLCFPAIVSLRTDIQKRKGDYPMIKVTRFKSLAAACVLLALGACQTLKGPSPSAVMRLETAGYQGLTSASGVSAGASRLSAAYICPPAKCGKLSVVVFGGGTSTSNALLTAEEQIRRGMFTDAAATRLFQKAFAAQQGSDMKVTRLRQFVTPVEAGFTFSATAKSRAGQRLFVRGRGTVVGDQTNVIVSLAETTAQAQRGLELAR